jgi:hypothetical protein
MKALKIEDVMSVYRGKDGRCCCGCAGKHIYAAAYQAAAGKRRGYKVDDDEVNDSSVKRVVNVINKNLDRLDMNESGIMSCVVGKTVYIAYLVEAL